MIDRLRADARLFPFLAGAVVLFGLLASRNPTLIQAGTYGAIYAIAALGVSMLVGNTAQVSIGQAGFFGIGAYAVAYLETTYHWPYLPSATVGIALAATFGLILGFISLRFRGHYLAMTTLAFGLIVVGVFRQSSAFGRANGIGNVPYPQFGPLTISATAAYWFAWLCVAASGALTYNLLRGRAGRAFEAIRNDELAAEVIGIPTRRFKILAFSYAGALAGFSGSIYVGYLGLVVPDAVGVDLSIQLLLMAVLGGVGGISGAVIGATSIGVANIYGHNLENWRPVIYGIAVVAIVIVFPRGLIGIFRRRLPKRRRSPTTMAAPAPAAPAGDASSLAAPAAGVDRWLEVSGATKRFGGLVAVDNVSFALESGKLTSLIGPNGAGKTTLFNAICGVGAVNAGRVVVAGRDVTKWQPHRIAALGVGRSFQNARLFGEMTVLENVVAGAFGRERSSFAEDLFGLPRSHRGTREATDRARATLAALGIERLADARAANLAFGDRRRVELARALAMAPGLLLVDEPAAGLNASERARLSADLRTLRHTGMTLLLIEHDMRLVMEISDRVMVLKFGKLIADGPPAQVRSDPQVIAAYLGSDAPAV